MLCQRTLRDLTFGSAEMRLDAQWIVGFVDGEGCFHVSVNTHREMIAGFQVLPEFTVVQHKKDVQILNALKQYFGCGVVRTNHGDRLSYRVRGKEHLLEKVVPFFEKHQLKTKKRLDFEKFRLVLKLMEKGQHLKPEGIAKIRDLASTISRGADKIKSGLHGNM